MSDDGPPKNLFIRWKHHVDTNIGITLQGIIGIPSVVFNKSRNDPWPEIEEARRQAEQALERQAKEQDPDLDTKSPQSAAWPFNTTNPKESTRTEPFPVDKVTASPPTSSRMPDSAAPSPTPSSNGDNPQNWTQWPDWVQLGRWHSFAAYSPYSPLNLDSLPQPIPAGYDPNSPPPLTFQDAFEDLLAISCGKPMPSILDRIQTRKVLNQMFPAGEPGFYWVRRLQSQGLLGGYFPSAEQVRRSLEQGRESYVEDGDMSEENPCPPHGPHVWKWVWSNRSKNAEEEERERVGDETEERNQWAEESGRSMDEWGKNEWKEEMDKVLKEAAKQVREITEDGGLFQELNRVFKAIGKAGDDIFSSVSGGQEKAPSTDEKSADPETEGDLFTLFSRFPTDPEKSLGTMVKLIKEKAKETRDIARASNKTPREKTTTRETVDPQTGVRTIHTTKTKVDENGNRTIRKEIRKLNADGEEISRQTSYSMRHSSSWSWTSANDEGVLEDDAKGNKDEEGKKSGWFWK